MRNTVAISELMGVLGSNQIRELGVLGSCNSLHSLAASGQQRLGRITDR